MPDVTPVESSPTPEAYRSVQGLIKEVQVIITEVYGLEDISAASERLWDSSDQELRKRLQQDLLPEPATYGVRQGDQDFGSIIHFPAPMMERLSQSTLDSHMRGDCLPDMLALIEETSHYIYREFYGKKFPGQIPQSANREMIGVIDKYNVLQAMFVKRFGRSMDSVENAQAVYHNALAAEETNWPGDRPTDYIIGHELGKQYVYFLNGLHNEGVDVTEGLRMFYNTSNRQQFEHLFYDLDFRVETRTPTETAAVQTTLRQIGAI